MVEISRAKNTFAPLVRCQLDDILAEIGQGTHAEAVNKLRGLPHHTPKEIRVSLKKQLPAFTGGIYAGPNRNQNSFQKTRVIILDIDHMTAPYDMPATGDPTEIRGLKADIQDSDIYAAFRSPSGDGIKVIYVIDTDIDDPREYRQMWSFLADRFKADYGYEPDEATKDATRLCYLSYDPDIYINKEALLCYDVISPQLSRDDIFEPVSIEINPGQENIFFWYATQLKVEHYNMFRNLCSAASNMGEKELAVFFDKLFATNRNNLSPTTAEALSKRDSYLRSFKSDHRRVPLQYITSEAVKQGIATPPEFIKKTGSKTAPLFKIDKIKESVIDWMNERYAVYQKGNGVVHIPQNRHKIYYDLSGGEPCATSALNTLQIQKRNDFQAGMANRRLYYVNERGEVTSIPYFDLWWNSPKRREAMSLKCEPMTNVPNNIVNSWTGFNVNPEKIPGIVERELEEGGLVCQPVLDFIYDTICCKDGEAYLVVINWMAEMLQNPTAKNKPGVAISLRSKAQGTGKGTFATIVRDIIGPVHCVQLFSGEKIASNFNSIIEDRLLIILDEALFAGDRRTAERLKSMITEPTVTIERKFAESYDKDNSARFLILSNNAHTVNVAIDDRRNFTLDISDEHKDDVEYFQSIRNCMGNGGKESLFNYLINWKVERDQLMVRRKRNKATLDQARQSFDDFDFWLMSLLDRQWIHLNDAPYGEDKKFLKNERDNHLSIRELYEDFAWTCKNRSVRYVDNEAVFEKKLDETIGLRSPFRVYDKRTKSTVTKYGFPSLNEIGEKNSIHQPLGWQKGSDNDNDGVME